MGLYGISKRSNAKEGKEINCNGENGNEQKKNRGMIRSVCFPHTIKGGVWWLHAHSRRRTGREEKTLPLEVLDTLVGGLEVGLGGVVLDDEFVDFGL